MSGSAHERPRARKRGSQRRAFRTYLLTGFLIAAGVPVLVVWACLSRLFVNRRHVEAESHLREAARESAWRINDYLDGQKRAIANLALAPGIERARTPEDLQLALASTRLTTRLIYDGFTGLAVVDRSGRVVAVDPPARSAGPAARLPGGSVRPPTITLSVAPPYNGPRDLPAAVDQALIRSSLAGAGPQAFVSGVTPDRTAADRATVTVGVGIAGRDGQVRYLLEGALDLTRLASVRDSFASIPNAQFVILDGASRVVFSSNPVQFPALAFVGGAPGPTPAGASVTEWESPSGTAGQTVNVLAGAARVNPGAGGGWTVVVMSGSDALKAEIAEYVAALLLGLACMLACVYIFALLAARQVTLPLEGLAASVRSVVGQSSPRLPQPHRVTNIEEIAQLQDDLSSMCWRLADSYTSLQANLAEREELSLTLQRSKDELRVANDLLEQRVLERTGELQNLVQQLEEQVMARAHTEDLLIEKNRIMEMIAADAALGETLEAIIFAAEADIPQSLAAVHILDEDENLLRLIAAPRLPEGFRQAIATTPLGPSSPPFGAAGWRKETIAIPTISRSPLWAGYRDAAAAHGLEASWSSPILNARRELLGTLTLFHRRSSVPDRRHQEVMDVATRTAAVAIDQARAAEVNRRLEAQLRHSQKLQAIGTLAGGIAHDFNNILTAIFGNAELLKYELPDDPRLQVHVSEILKASQRARDLVRQILTFSRKQEEALSLIQLKPTLEEVVALMKATAPASVEVRTVFLEDEPAVLANSSQIHQVLMNLCTNGLHAMRSSGGVLTISQTETRLDDRDNMKPGRYLCLTVSDTGHGMDKRTIERIFDPFFTTKEPGEGTGLGLSVVHGIVNAHQGAVSVESELWRGTSFHIYLPIPPARTMADGQIPLPTLEALVPSILSLPAVRPEGRGPEERRSGTVLLVDDEVAITSLGAKVLERLGFKARVFNAPVAALAWFSENPAVCDVVVSDYSMPGMPGEAFASALLRIRPDIPIVLITGYGAAFDRERAKAAGITDILLKPFTIETLGSTLARALENVPVGAPPTDELPFPVRVP